MTHFERDQINVPIVIRAVGGDLRIKGRNGTMLVVDGDGVQVEQIGPGQPYMVQSAGDCRMSVPETVPVSVQGVGGDAKLTDLNGSVDVQSVGGDLILRSVQDARIGSIGGDLRLKWAQGSVTIENVGSDATIREICGAVSVANVGADLYLRNIEGNCVIEQVGSDLVLNITFVPGQEYRFVAGGGILCRVQPDTNARFIVPRGTQVELDVEAVVTETEHEQVITLGTGEAVVYLEAGSELRFVGEEEDYVINLGAQIEEELDARLSTLEERISAQLDGLDERIQSNSEHWVRQAEHMAERAQQQAERTVEHIRQRMEHRNPQKKKRHQFTMSWSTPPAPPRAPAPPGRSPKAPQVAEPISEQERLMILRMVQEGKITIEEAERLLAALEP